jgi:hypothetical protein
LGWSYDKVPGCLDLSVLWQVVIEIPDAGWGEADLSPPQARSVSESLEELCKIPSVFWRSRFNWSWADPRHQHIS